MDFKALMTKLETIDKRQVLNESVKNTKPAPKIDKQVITESPEMKSSIARMLMQEFGIGEDNETGAQQNPGTIYSYNPVKDFKARRAVDKTQAAADANPEVYGYGGGAEAPQGTTIAAQDPAGETPELNIGQGNPTSGPIVQPVRAPDVQTGPQDDATGVDAAVAAQSGANAATQPAAGTQADDAFQQANAEPSQDDPAQGGDAIGQAAAAGVARPTAQTQPAQPGTGDASVAQAMANKPAAQAPAGGQYVIKPGDNLTKIAKANGTTIKDIMAVNPQIKDPNKIMAGAKLNLPGKAAASAAAAPQKSDAAKLAAGEAPVEETLSLIKRLAGLR